MYCVLLCLLEVFEVLEQLLVSEVMCCVLLVFWRRRRC